MGYDYYRLFNLGGTMVRDLNGNGVIIEAAERLGIQVNELLETLARKHAHHREPEVLTKVFQDHFRDWIPLPQEILDDCWDIAAQNCAVT